MRISDWSSDVCSSDLSRRDGRSPPHQPGAERTWRKRRTAHGRSIHIHVEIVAAARHAVGAKLRAAGAALIGLAKIHTGFTTGQLAALFFHGIFRTAKLLPVGEGILLAAAPRAGIARIGEPRMIIVDRTLCERAAGARFFRFTRRRDLPTHLGTAYIEDVARENLSLIMTV